MNNYIDNFNGEFNFLNNDFECEILFNKKIYSSITKAYLASITDKEYLRNQLQKENNLKILHEISLLVNSKNQRSPDENLLVMESLLRDKFIRNNDLRIKLINTNDKILINRYKNKTNNNLFWGCIDEEGHNHTGKLLMKIREDCVNGIDLEKWFLFNQSIEKDNNYLCGISVKIKRKRNILLDVELDNKHYYTIGCSKKSDIILYDSPSKLKKQFVIVNKIKGLYIINLVKDQVIYLNGIVLKYLIPKLLKYKSKIKYEHSSYTIKLKCEYKKLKNKIENQLLTIGDKIKLIEYQINNPEYKDNLYKENTIIVSCYKDKIFERIPIFEFFENFGKINKLDIINYKSKHKSSQIIIQFNDSKPYNELISKKIIEYNNDYLYIKRYLKSESELINEAYTFSNTKPRQRSYSK